MDNYHGGMDSPQRNTWILDADHAIETWYESTPESVTYLARCKCGWHVESSSAGARNWNVDGHAKDVREANAY